jgi:hypothetical protein
MRDFIWKYLSGTAPKTGGAVKGQDAVKEHDIPDFKDEILEAIKTEETSKPEWYKIGVTGSGGQAAASGAGRMVDGAVMSAMQGRRNGKTSRHAEAIEALRKGLGGVDKTDFTPGAAGTTQGEPLHEGSGATDRIVVRGLGERKYKDFLTLNNIKSSRPSDAQLVCIGLMHGTKCFVYMSKLWLKINGHTIVTHSID